MTDPSASCPDLERLEALLGNQPPISEQHELLAHLDLCDACQHRLDELTTDPSLLSALADGGLATEFTDDAALRRVIGRFQSDGSCDSEPAPPNRSPPLLDFLTPSSDTRLLGLLGPYEVVELIGVGGMGVVLKGRDPRLNRLVAIKVPVTEHALRGTARRRFLREAQAAAAISHDHVVAIHAVDEANGVPLLVMEYISGSSLQQRIDDGGPLEVKQILRIAMQTAEGLAAAHAQGVIHRDIKPANILLENGVERVKITDFGLARAVDDVHLTRSGQLAGTPEYMSPEQARGEAVDHRTDLFSLGSVIYAMCTGCPPFQAETTLGMIRRVCEDAPREIRQLNSDIPHWLAQVVDALMVKDARHRFPSAQEVAELLRGYLAHLQQPSVVPIPILRHSSTAPAAPSQRSFPRWLQFLAAVLLATTMCGLALTETNGVTHVVNTVIHMVRGDGILALEIDDPSIEVTIDGQDVIVSDVGGAKIRLRPGQHRLHASKHGQVLHRESVTITRGGRRVVKLTREPTVSDTHAIVSRRIWTGPDVELTGTVSPNGRYLSYVDWSNGNLALRDFAAQQSRHLTTAGTWNQPNQCAEASVWCSDSRTLAYMWEYEGVWQLRVRTIDSPEHRVIYQGAAEELVYPLTWTADDQHVVTQLMSKERLNRIVLISVADGTVHTLRDLGRRGPGATDCSPDGRFLVYEQRRDPEALQGDLFLVRIDTQEERPLVEHPAQDRSPLFSSDGRWVVFISDRSGTEALWAVPIADGAASGPPQRIQHGVFDARPLGFSHDGQYFYGIHQPTTDVYQVEFDSKAGEAKGVPQKVFERFEGFNRAADWSADGRRLVYFSRRSSPGGTPALTLVIHTLTTKEEKRLSPPIRRLVPDATPRWRPNAESVLLPGIDAESRFSCQLVDVRNGVSTGLVQDRAIGATDFSPDGRQLFYVAYDDPYEPAIVVHDLNSGETAELHRQRRSGTPMLAVSPDGKELAFTYGRSLQVMPIGGSQLRVLWTNREGLGFVSKRLFRRSPRRADGGSPAVFPIPPTLSASVATVLRQSLDTSFRGGLVWTRDGEHLLIGKMRNRNSDINQVWRISIRGGDPHPIGLEMIGLSHLRISPDGNQITFTGNLTNRKCEVWVLKNLLPPLTDVADSE